MWAKTCFVVLPLVVAVSHGYWHSPMCFSYIWDRFTLNGDYVNCKHCDCFKIKYNNEHHII